MKDKIEKALELLRRARNNMSRDEYLAAVRDLCEDGNNRYPLLEAGNVAAESHQRAVAALDS